MEGGKKGNVCRYPNNGGCWKGLLVREGLEGSTEGEESLELVLMKSDTYLAIEILKTKVLVRSRIVGDIYCIVIFFTIFVKYLKY